MGHRIEAHVHRINFPSSLLPLTGVDISRAEGGGDDAEPLLAAGRQRGQVRLLRRRRQEPQDGAARSQGAHQVHSEMFQM